MTAPIETKVTAATAGTAVGTAIAGFIIWVLDTYVFKDQPVPDPVIVLVWAIVPAGVAFLSGLFAPHTPRVDLVARRRMAEKNGFVLVPSDERPASTQSVDTESDPRTDGVGDGGENELPPPSDEVIQAGVEHDQAHRARTLKEMSE